MAKVSTEDKVSEMATIVVHNGEVVCHDGEVVQHTDT